MKQAYYKIAGPVVKPYHRLVGKTMPFFLGEYTSDLVTCQPIDPAAWMNGILEIAKTIPEHAERPITRIWDDASWRAEYKDVPHYHYSVRRKIERRALDGCTEMYLYYIDLSPRFGTLLMLVNRNGSPVMQDMRGSGTSSYRANNKFWTNFKPYLRPIFEEAFGSFYSPVYQHDYE